MNFKINTKEKFQEIMLQELVLSANMAAEIEKLLLSFMKKEVKNVILSLEKVQEISGEVLESIANVQDQFQQENISFVICDLQKQVEKNLEETNLTENLNIVPTLSEAWDIVQMEEIEREFLKD